MVPKISRSFPRRASRRNVAALMASSIVGVMLVGCTIDTSVVVPPMPGATTPSSEAVSSPDVESIMSLINQRRALSFLDDLQAVADAHDGNRAAGTDGAAASRDLVAETLKDAGLKVTREPFVSSNGFAGENLFAEIPGTSDDVVLLGAHLDSVTMGPGLNDNASGVGTLVETALIEAQRDSARSATVRFAFWDAEEIGILGSSAYVEQLPAEEKEGITAYVNYDMTATLDGYVGIIDSDLSSIDEHPEEIRDLLSEMYSGADVASDSTRVEQTLWDFYRAANLDGFELRSEIMTLANSDTLPFLADGTVPYSGIGMLGADQEVDDDGTILFAACYHQACDTRANIDEDAYLTSIGSALHVIDTLAD